jgi:hypothetical protein
MSPICWSAHKSARCRLVKRMSLSRADSPEGGASRAGARLARALGGALALAFMVALTWDVSIGIWTDGRFHDTDDATRMVQIRDLLAGQGLFDLTQYRLLPPAGMPMHWTRLADMPTAGLVWAFSFALDPVPAERLARLGYSLLFAALLLFSMARLARTLCGPAAIGPALAITAMGGFTFSQFQPGRIDHHAPQIVLLVAIFDCVLRALDPARTRWAATGGVLIALSIGIGVENAPFIAAACAIPALRWVAVGGPAAPAMRAFAAGLAGGILIVYALFSPEGAGARGACDAISLAFVTAGLAVAAGLQALSLTGARLGSPGVRLAAGAGAGVAALSVVGALFPACMAHPYVTMDRLVYEVWFSNIGESQPWLATALDHPSAAPMTLMPQLLGLAGLCWAVAVTTGLERARWIGVLGAFVLGLPFALMEVRVTSQIAVFTSLGAVFAALRLVGALQAGGALRAPTLTLLGLAAIAPFSTQFWGLATPDALAAWDKPKAFDYDSCRAPAQFAVLAQKPKALVMAPVDLGPHVLAFTPHAVLAAPYHRNSAGNRMAIDTFLAAPQEARALATRSGAAYLAFCNDLVQADVMARRAPDGLAAALMRGERFDWLAPLPGEGALKVYELR